MILVVFTYCYRYLYLILLIIIIITIALIILLLLLLYFFVIIVIISIVLSITNVTYFILSHFISCCSYYYDFCLCVACDVYVSSRIFFLFSYYWFKFYNRIAYTCQESFFFCHYRLYHHCHHHNHFIFFNTTSHWGRIQQMNSSSMAYPYPLITLGKP